MITERTSSDKVKTYTSCPLHSSLVVYLLADQTLMTNDKKHVTMALLLREGYAHPRVCLTYNSSPQQVDCAFALSSRRRTDARFTAISTSYSLTWDRWWLDLRPRSCQSGHSGLLANSHMIYTQVTRSAFDRQDEPIYGKPDAASRILIPH